MKWWMLMVMALFGSVLGCDCNTCCGPYDTTTDQSCGDRWLVTAIADDGIKNAVVAQHTLFPYHFVENSAELNPLGQHDLSILAEHFARNPGELSVRRGAVSKSLYDARVQAVLHALAQDGVAADQMKISDAFPAGEGMASDRVVTILRTEKGNITRQPIVLGGNPGNVEPVPAPSYNSTGSN